MEDIISKYLKTKGKGVWKVSTEGDEEGNTTEFLGVYEGDIVDIAFKLADKCMYTLEFSLLDKTDLEKFYKPTANHVNVRFPSEFYNKNPDKQYETFKELLKDNDKVIVSESSIYETVKLNLTNEQQIQRKKEQILSKLTKEEIEFLKING